MAALRRSTRCCGHLPLPLLVYVFLTGFNTSRATDTLRQGGNITVAQPLVSAGGVFELGFFMPSGSTNRYVGIWYGGITPQTVVWVANRGKPIADGSGSLTVDSYGSLIILDGIGNSEMVAQGLGKGTTSYATLRDSGNLVLRGGDSGGTLWQSFDYPTDTWLPEMRLGSKGKQNRQLTSWRSSQDPSSGDFRFKNEGGRVLISQKGNRLWDGGDLADLVTNAALYYNVSISVNYVSSSKAEDDEYFFYQPNPYGSHDSYYSLTRIVMEAEGQVRLWAWGRGKWTLLWAQPANYKYASKGGRKRQLLIALPVVLVTSILGAFILCCFLRRKRDGKEEENGEELLLRDMGMDGAVTYKFVDVNVGGNDRGPEIYVYSFSNVLAATNNFSDDNKLGQGGFGPVYKGKLPDGQEIAIKRLSIRSGQGLFPFSLFLLFSCFSSLNVSCFLKRQVKFSILILGQWVEERDLCSEVVH